MSAVGRMRAAASTKRYRKRPCRPASCCGSSDTMEAAWDKAKKTKPTERAHLRERDFACTLSLLKKVAVRLAARARPTTRLGEACSYLLAQWEPLTAHLAHGQTRLDTNIVENAIRPTKLGAKNWLFIGHPDAGQRSAIIYSIAGSCRRHDIDPFLYLRDVLTRLPAMTNRDDLSGLLPSKGSVPGTTSTTSNPQRHVPD